MKNKNKRNNVMRTTCLECGKTFIYVDKRNKPATCGDKVCVTNYKYRKKRFDPRTKSMPTPEETKKL